MTSPALPGMFTLVFRARFPYPPCQPNICKRVGNHRGDARGRDVGALTAPLTNCQRQPSMGNGIGQVGRPDRAERDRVMGQQTLHPAIGHQRTLAVETFNAPVEPAHLTPQ